MRKPAERSIPVVVVKWGDAFTYTDTMPVKDISSKPLNSVTVGVLLRDDADGVTVVGELVDPDSFPDEESRARYTHFVPRGMVQEVIRIGTLRLKRKDG